MSVSDTLLRLPGQPRTPAPTPVPPEVDVDPDELDELEEARPFDVDACEACGGVGEVPADINGWNRYRFARVCRSCDGTGDRRWPA